MAKNKCPECKEGAPAWMTTYGDMVTLLMAFFVMLFAFSNIDAQKFEQVMRSFQGSAGILSGGKSVDENTLIFESLPESSETVVKQDTVEDVEEELKQLQSKIQEYIQENDLETEISIEFDTRGLIIRFKDNALFDSGKAEIKKSSEQVLYFIGDLLKSEEFLNRAIRVEGHTDNIPIQTSKYPSNWELSTARSTNVVRFFISSAKISPERLSASGYSEYYPIADNSKSEGRAKNRRVDIVILSRFFENTGPQQENELNEEKKEVSDVETTLDNDGVNNVKVMPAESSNE